MACRGCASDRTTPRWGPDYNRGLNYARAMPMDAPPWTVTAFQEARRDTWRTIRIWLLVLVVGMIGFAIPFWLNRSHLHMTAPGRYSLSAADETVGQFTSGLASIVVAGAAAIGSTVGLRRHYRCPKCNAMPMNTRNSLVPNTLGLNRGVFLNPSVCGSCDAPLSLCNR